MIWVAIVVIFLISSASSLLSIKKSSRSIILFISIAILIAISGVRYKTGYDFDQYIKIFNSISAGDDFLGVELGWIVLNRFIFEILNSPVGVYALSSFFIYGPLAWVLYRESRYAAFGMLAFVLQVYFYWESLSIIRQYVAISLAILAAYYWISCKKAVSLILYLTAISFHTPAAIVIVTPLLIKWQSRSTLIILAFLGGIILENLLSNYFYDIELIGKYQAYLDGTIAAEAEINTGLVLYVRLFIALLLVFQVDRSIYIDEGRKNLVANSIILAYALFFSFYESTAMRRVAYYFLIYEAFAIVYLARISMQKTSTWSKYTAIGTISLYLIFGATILAKDVWMNPVGRQEDSQKNYEYRTIFE